jgi:hypothetical protein
MQQQHGHHLIQLLNILLRKFTVIQQQSGMQQFGGHTITIGQAT